MNLCFSESVKLGMDSASLGSDSAITNLKANSSEAKTQNMGSLGDELESPEFAGRKKRGARPGGGEKGGRGLRYFSMKVCEKVESKRSTTYNEVADELVAEFTYEESLLATSDQQQYDEKNIRRRIYDALNVLMAMEIISKDKKEIHWRGIPSIDVEDIELLKAEHTQVKGRIEKKKAHLRELEEQVVGIQNLIERNESLFRSAGSVPANGVALPFILVQTRPHAVVEVEISEDMQLVHFDFNSTPFKLHDDAFVLKAMRFGNSAMSMQRSNDEPTPGMMTKTPGMMMKSEHIGQEHVSTQHVSSNKQCMPTSRSLANQYQSGYLLPRKCSSALPLPGILKARVKQEYHN